jgi:F420-dependent oxidoreductase-like protein
LVSNPEDRFRGKFLKLKFGYQQPSHTFENVSGEEEKRANVTIFDQLSDIAKSSEELGYDSFWIMDHLTQISFAGNYEEPIMESYTTLSALAPLTHKIKLGALATCNIFRNPALLAKMGATIDQISKGRFWLGIGAGWFEDEAKRYGFKFQNYKTRLEMLEEALQIIEKAWTEQNPTFFGKYYSMENLILSPKPIQKPRPKILVGGGGEKITLKLAAKYADACNLFSSGEELQRKLDSLRKHCKDVGRDYSTILKTRLASVMFGKNKDDAIRKIEQLIPPPPNLESYVSSFLLGNPSEISNQVSSLRDAGIEYLIINFRGKYDPSFLEIFSKEIMSRF